ncbi:hypothetical protein [Lacinutrix sp. MEBiC02404]
MPKILFFLLTTLLLSCNSESDINEIKYWTYKIDYDFKDTRNTLKPIGQIEFLRTKSIPDKLRKEVYNEPWFPAIDFEIYNLSDLKYCEEVSKKTKFTSSCVDESIGGDIIIVGNYIFINTWACVNCVGTKNGTDFCRPILNNILSKLNLTESSTLKDIDKEIGMKIKRAE